MMTLQPDFKEFFSLLNKYSVKYLLVGGYAVAFYGFIRNTNDIDIWIKNDEQNIDKILKCLIEFGFSESQLQKEVFLKKNQIIRMGVPPLRIELLTSISGVEFNDVYKKREIYKHDINIDIIDLESLKINKKASGRLKDLYDLENL